MEGEDSPISNARTGEIEDPSAAGSLAPTAQYGVAVTAP